MILIEKLKRYLRKRKSATTVSELADRFIVSRSAVSNCLKQLSDKIICLRIGRTFYYRLRPDARFD